MAGTFKFEIKGLDKLQKRLNAVPAKVRKEVGAEIQDGARRIHGKQVRLAPVDEGGLKQATEPKKVNELQVELTASKHYTPFMEFGTKRRIRIPSELRDYAKQFNVKGPKIDFDAFLLIITAWVKRKGIDEKAAYPIALSILRHGVKPHPFFFQPFFDEREGIVKNVEKVLKDL
jgi:HK97 gp10 family phage protein